MILIRNLAIALSAAGVSIWLMLAVGSVPIAASFFALGTIVAAIRLGEAPAVAFGAMCGMGLTLDDQPDMVSAAVVETASLAGLGWYAGRWQRDVRRRIAESGSDRSVRHGEAVAERSRGDERDAGDDRQPQAVAESGDEGAGVRGLLEAVAGISQSLNEQRILEATVRAVMTVVRPGRVTIHLHDRKSDRPLPGVSLPEAEPAPAADGYEAALRFVAKSRRACYRARAADGAAEAFAQSDPSVDAVLPLFDRAMLAGFLVVHGARDAASAESLEIIAAACGLALSGARLSARCESQSRMDPLCGVLVADAIREQLEVDLARGPASVILLAADHLRRVNENYGRKTGDRTLAALAKLVVREVGQEGVVGRYGGASLLVLLPGRRIDQATALAERIMRRVKTSIVAGPEGLAEPLTVCAGVSYASVGTAEMLLVEVEKAMNTAQRRGPDQLCARVEECARA